MPSANSIQSKTGNQSGYVTTPLNVALDNPVTAGNFIALCIINNGGSASPTDSQGNTYIKVEEGTTGGGAVSSLWYAYNVNGGATTVTVDMGASYTDTVIIIQEFDGVLSTADPLDVSEGTQEVGFASSHTSGNTATPSEDYQLVIGIYNCTNSAATISITGGSSLGGLLQDNGGDVYAKVSMAHFVMSTAAVQNAAFTTSTTTNGFCAVATFKLTPVAGGSATLMMMGVGA
jgi:hypothetical protein